MAPALASIESSPPRCPRCHSPIREERSHYRCEICGIVAACCEGECAQPFMVPTSQAAPTEPNSKTS